MIRREEQVKNDTFILWSSRSGEPRCRVVRYMTLPPANPLPQVFYEIGPGVFTSTFISI